jgi:hypothetical protein
MTFDLNQAAFQSDLVDLEKAELLAFIKTFRKLQQLYWSQIYRDKGRRWEKISSLPGDLYSLRITKQCRALVKREGDVMRFISLHPDHDSAYQP